MFLPEVPVAFEACDQLFIDGEDGRRAILGVELSHMTKQPRIQVYGHANMLHDEFQNCLRATWKQMTIALPPYMYLI